MIKTSTNHNPNYLAKIVDIKNFKKHPNADRLKIATVDFVDIITGIDNPEGIYVYFPVESQLSDRICKELNLYTDSTMNNDTTQTGYVGKNRRVKALKLRGTKSFGLLLPAVEVFEAYYDELEDIDSYTGMIDTYFDTIGDKVIVSKYEPKTREYGTAKTGRQAVQVTRVVDGQVHLHEDTQNLRRYINQIDPEGTITISDKFHGTSGWASNVIVKKQLRWWERLAKRLRLNVVDTEYDVLYGSRRVIKNRGYFTKANHYYNYDIWGDVVDRYDLKNILPPGYSLYYEIVGFTKDGAYIQKDYDYGCEKDGVGYDDGNFMGGENKMIVYRVTNTNAIGQVYNLNTMEAKAFTESLGLEFVPILFNGTLTEWANNNAHSGEGIIESMEAMYNNHDCKFCSNVVPAEGVVVRVERNDKFEAYKLKSADFLLKETKQLDNDES